MISSLRGIITDIEPPTVFIDVNGVGYAVDMPMTSICKLPKTGETVKVYTHLSVREDAHQLFGFTEKIDRSLFRELIKVNGIGPRSAISILSGMNVSEIINVIRANDSVSLTKIPGIGKKTAERLLIELKDRVEKLFAEEMLTVENPQSNSQSTVDDGQAKRNQELAVNAMVELGYNRKQSEGFVKKVFKPGMAVEEIIRDALKATFGG